MTVGDMVVLGVWGTVLAFPAGVIAAALVQDLYRIFRSTP